MDTILSQLQKLLSGFLPSAALLQLKEAFQELKQIDTQLTQLAKTGSYSQNALERLGKAAAASAQQYGSTVSGYLSAVQEMAQLGFDPSKQEALANLSLLAQSAGEITAELAAKYLAAADSAYQLNGNAARLNEILDGQFAVANRSALSFSQLAEATQSAASQAAASGITVEELSASLATMMAATRQSGDDSSDALLHILTNLRQVSEAAGPGKLSAGGLTNLQKACGNLNVSLTEVQNGASSLREPMEILEDLSQVYRSLSETDSRKTDLTDALGYGTDGRQLQALLENWDTYEELLDTYTQGSGSALAAAEQNADSWQGLLNRISGSWTGFVQTFADDGLITNALNLLNELLKGLGSITKKTGILIPLLGGAGISAFTKNFD